MKKYRLGELNPNYMEELVEVQPFDFARREPLKRLNFIMEFIEKKNLDFLEKFVSNLSKNYKKLVKEDAISKKKIDMKEVFVDFQLLEKHTELAKLSLNYYLQLHQIPDTVNWKKDKIKIPNKNQLLSFLHPRYYNLFSLIETIGREEAIKLYKQYVTHYYNEAKKNRENSYPDVKTLFEKRIEPKEKPSDWVIVTGLINEGKYAYKNENCMWVDVLEHLPDQEIKYYICCYGDYGSVKFHNENFILTMEHTIALGDPYCSRVIHDIRVDYDLRHPSKEFWDKFNP
ncbi:MAG: L-2-amino-thiazoline-4-carboxylic acid hydrolase [Candidatus Heimdallarchaeota archaeon]|nr:L-2-amino-thiazoline-4-carboxylic acid hydrolase [Candidatus Heimdallarchaeota archaeon]MBY8993891.1 L-2-amino-thiazoline-4-carboxylic acid hydrolase [Candidatus Heimdallarchaeota archaeon]